MKIITGRAKTGKSTYIFDEIGREIDKGTKDNLILIVPDLMTYQTEFDIIERLNAEGIINVDILSFKRLADKILEDVGGYKVNEITDIGRIMLLKQLFEENSLELKVFKKASSQEGFLREFNRLLQELKQNLVDPNSLKDVSNKTENYFIQSKFHDIYLIYSKYNEKLKDNFLDAEDRFLLSISKIKDSSLIKNSKVWIDGFESLNQQRINFIKNLVDYSKSVTLSLNIDSKYISDLEAFDDWEYFKTIYDTFKDIKDLMGEDLEILPLNDSFNPSNEIRAIESNLFSFKPEVYSEKTTNINIYSSMNPYTETEKLAAKMIALIRDHNYRWKDIKVALGDMDKYSSNIKKIFDKYQIPYFLDTKRDIMDNPLSKYLISLLDIFIWNFKYENVFEYLKSNFSSLDKTQVSRLENYALKYGIEGSKWFKNFNDNPEMDEIRQAFVLNFEGKMEEFKALSSISDITKFILDYLEEDKVYEKIQEMIRSFINQNKYQESSEFSQVWNYVMEIFEQILLVEQNSYITPLEYRKILESGLKEVKVSIIPPTIDKVEIGDMSRVAVSNSKALFILGANEGNFDSNNEKGILQSEEREILLQNNIKILSGSNFSYFKDKHMQYKVFSSSREKLYISYALGTLDGSSLQPSLYIDTLKKIFTSLEEKSDITDANDLEYITNRSGTYDKLVENIRKYVDGDKIDPIWKDLFVWYKENDSQRFEIIEESLNYTNQVEDINPEILKKIFSAEINMSVSKLETYAQCPFKYFVENILKPKPRESQKVEFYDLGNINHEVLEDFINKLFESSERINVMTEDEVESKIKDSIEKVLFEQSKKVTALDANNRNKYLKEKIQRVLNRTANTIVKQLQNSEFRPRFTELQIGVIDKNDKQVKNGNFIDPIEIRINDQIVKLRGKIDRVDAFEDDNGHIYISIIDYKSSANDIDLGDASEGIQMQLLVYLNAILQNGEKLFGKKPKVGGIFYYHIDDPIINKNIDNPEEEIFKELKLKGLVLKDKEIVSMLDNSLEASSSIIPVGIKKDGEFTANSNVLSEDEFQKLLLFVHGKCSEITLDILNGNFDINPYKKYNGQNPCSYCEYMSICQFDKTIGNDYRYLRKLNKNDVIASIMSSGGEENGVDK